MGKFRLAYKLVPSTVVLMHLDKPAISDTGHTKPHPQPQLGLAKTSKTRGPFLNNQQNN